MLNPIEKFKVATLHLNRIGITEMLEKDEIKLVIIIYHWYYTIVNGNNCATLLRYEHLHLSDFLRWWATWSIFPYTFPQRKHNFSQAFLLERSVGQWTFGHKYKFSYALKISRFSRFKVFKIFFWECTWPYLTKDNVIVQIKFSLSKYLSCSGRSNSTQNITRTQCQ